MLKAQFLFYYLVYFFVFNVFLSIHTEESLLLDLKHLLIEAKQKVPPFLAALQSENEQYLDMGGSYYIIIILCTIYISIFCDRFSQCVDISTCIFCN